MPSEGAGAKEEGRFPSSACCDDERPHELDAVGPPASLLTYRVLLLRRCRSDDRRGPGAFATQTVYREQKPTRSLRTAGSTSSGSRSSGTAESAEHRCQHSPLSFIDHKAGDDP